MILEIDPAQRELLLDGLSLVGGDYGDGAPFDHDEDDVEELEEKLEGLEE